MRLIDADALIEQMEADAEHMEESLFEMAAYAAINDVKHQPTIEPERKKGRWIECDHDKWVVGVHALRCSECNGGYHLNTEMTIYYWNYCPNCGAELRGGEDAAD